MIQQWHSHCQKPQHENSRHFTICVPITLRTCDVRKLTSFLSKLRMPSMLDRVERMRRSCPACPIDHSPLSSKSRCEGHVRKLASFLLCAFSNYKHHPKTHNFLAMLEKSPSDLRVFLRVFGWLFGTVARQLSQFFKIASS